MRCVKCGGVMGDPRYREIVDRLQYTCTVCGYTYERLPNDRQKPRDGELEAILDRASADTTEARR